MTVRRQALLLIRDVLKLVESRLESAKHPTVEEVIEQHHPKKPDPVSDLFNGTNEELPMEDLMYSRPGQLHMDEHQRVYWEAQGGLERLLKKIRGVR